MPRWGRSIDDRVVYVTTGLLVIGVFIAGMAVMAGSGAIGAVGIEPAFVFGFAIFVVIYFVSMYVSRYL